MPKKKRGLDRLRDHKPVSLEAIAERLPRRMLTDEEIEDWVQTLSSAVRGKKMASSVGTAAGIALETLIERYGG